MHIPDVSGGQSNHILSSAFNFSSVTKRSRTAVCAQCSLVVMQVQPIQDLWDPITAGIGSNDGILRRILIKLRDHFLL